MILTKQNDLIKLQTKSLVLHLQMSAILTFHQNSNDISRDSSMDDILDIFFTKSFSTNFFKSLVSIDKIIF